MGMGCDASNVDLAGVKLDEEQDIPRDQPAQRPYFGTEEVSRPQDIHMTANECLPRGRLLALRSRWERATFEDVAHRLVADLVAQMRQGTDNAVITPATILFGHLYDQVFELLIDARAPQRFAFL